MYFIAPSRQSASFQRASSLTQDKEEERLCRAVKRLHTTSDPRETSPESSEVRHTPCTSLKRVFSSLRGMLLLSQSPMTQQLRQLSLP